MSRVIVLHLLGSLEYQTLCRDMFDKDNCRIFNTYVLGMKKALDLVFLKHLLVCRNKGGNPSPEGGKQKQENGGGQSKGRK